MVAWFPTFVRPCRSPPPRDGPSRRPNAPNDAMHYSRRCRSGQPEPADQRRVRIYLPNPASGGMLGCALQHLARSWLPAPPGRGYFAVMAEFTHEFYADDSGSRSDTLTITASGFLAPVERWDEFKPKWKAYYATGFCLGSHLNRLMCANRFGICGGRFRTAPV